MFHAVGVLRDERLPRRAPSRRAPERVHAGGADRPPVGVDPEIAAADEVEPGVVEVVVGPVVDGDALRRQAVPVVQSSGKSAVTLPIWLWLK